MCDWHEDILGAGFTSLTLPLTDNDDGPGVATLVRYLPQTDPDFPGFYHESNKENPRFVFLYVHGWNDYFYQAHLAKEIARCGGAFYALDLRAYGRSLREWQTPGWSDDLRSYDEDFNRAFKVVRKLHKNLPIVLGGHSTGGIICSFWVKRHPNVVAGMLINSPWIDIPASSLVRLTSTPLVASISTTYDPRQVIPVSDTGFYQRVLTGYRDPEESVPKGEEDDIFWQEGGWNPHPVWRNSKTHPVRAGWLWAVLEAQGIVQAGLEISAPVLVLHSAISYDGTQWSDLCRNADTVLDVEQIRQSALKIGDKVTVVRLHGAIHDVFLSRKKVRNTALYEVRRWIDCYI